MQQRQLSPTQRHRLDVWTNTKQLIAAEPALQNVRPPIHEQYNIAVDQAVAPAEAPQAISCPVSIRPLDCLYAAQEIVRALPPDQQGSVAVLNMANQEHMGGGIDHGAGAQEEDLFRRTNLVESLKQRNNPPNSYNFGEFGSLYSPGITVLRKGSNSQDRNQDYAVLPQAERFQINVISSAAYDLRDNDQTFGQGARNPDYNPVILNKRPDQQTAEDRQYIQRYETNTKKKIRQQLRTAVAHGQKHLILSAFGCGAFQNPPQIMARLYKEILQESEFANKFNSITFAIIPNPGRVDQNFETFRAVFNPAPAAQNNPAVTNPAPAARPNQPLTQPQLDKLNTIFQDATSRADQTDPNKRVYTKDGKSYAISSANGVEALQENNSLEEYKRMFLAALEIYQPPLYFVHADPVELEKMKQAYEAVKHAKPELPNLTANNYTTNHEEYRNRARGTATTTTVTTPPPAPDNNQARELTAEEERAQWERITNHRNTLIAILRTKNHHFVGNDQNRIDYRYGINNSQFEITITTAMPPHAGLDFTQAEAQAWKNGNQRAAGELENQLRVLQLTSPQHYVITPTKDMTSVDRMAYSWTPELNSKISITAEGVNQLAQDPNLKPLINILQMRIILSSNNPEEKAKLMLKILRGQSDPKFVTFAQGETLQLYPQVHRYNDAVMDELIYPLCKAINNASTPKTNFNVGGCNKQGVDLQIHAIHIPRNKFDELIVHYERLIPQAQRPVNQP